jgi:hypothetical protein
MLSAALGVFLAVLVVPVSSACDDLMGASYCGDVCKVPDTVTTLFFDGPVLDLDCVAARQNLVVGRRGDLHVLWVVLIFLARSVAVDQSADPWGPGLSW